MGIRRLPSVALDETGRLVAVACALAVVLGIASVGFRTRPETFVWSALLLVPSTSVFVVAAYALSVGGSRTRPAVFVAAASAVGAAALALAAMSDGLFRIAAGNSADTSVRLQIFVGVPLVGATLGSAYALCLHRSVRERFRRVAQLVVVVAVLGFAYVLRGGLVALHRGFALTMVGFQVALTGALVVSLAPGSSPPSSRRERGWLSVPFVVFVVLFAWPDGARRAAGESSPAFALRSHAAFYGALTDFDLDGFSGSFGGGDCAPFTAAVHPTALDVPGDGIDQNCSGEDAAVRGPAPRYARVRPPTSGHVVLVTIDTLRPDHTGILDPDVKTTPVLSRMARTSRTFANAFGAGTWTTISLGGMFTGRRARDVPWRLYGEDWNFGLSETSASNRESARRLYTLPERGTESHLASRLRNAGVSTRAFVDEGYSKMLSAETSFSEGFQEYVLTRGEGGNGDDDATSKAASDAICGSDVARPSFVWVHFFGPHDPSTRHDGVPLTGTSVSDLYDHEIAHVDRAFGNLAAAIGRCAADTLLLVGSDHGERLTETGRWHGTGVEADVARVVLLARGPGFTPGTTNTTVSLVDVYETVLAHFGFAAEGATDGTALQTIAAGKDVRRVVYVDNWKLSPSGTVLANQTAAYDGCSGVGVDYATGLARRSTGCDLEGDEETFLVKALGAYADDARPEVRYSEHR
ncbi:MAG: sulfatase-like hydrolase/transferase [Polyangiaceae bacterium]